MSKEFKVGLLATISGAILFFGFNFLKGVNFFDPSSKYYALYDHIDGLNISNPVVVNGFSVGRVNNITILQDQNNQILVELSVKQDLVLGKNTKATLMNSDFMGSKSILLEIGSLSEPLESGDTLKSAIDEGLAAFLEQGESITNNIGTTITRLNEILLGMEGSGTEIKETLEALKHTVKNTNTLVYQSNKNLNATLINANTLIQNINDKVTKLDPVLTNANGTLEKINNLEIEKSIAELNTSLEQLSAMMTSINEGQGTLGKIVKDDSLYNSLNQALVDLDILLVNFNNNPKHFLGPLGKSKKKIGKDRAKEQAN